MVVTRRHKRYYKLPIYPDDTSKKKNLAFYLKPKEYSILKLATL